MKKVWFVLVAAVLVILVMWGLRFHPIGVKVITSPNKANRALADARGLDEVVVLVLPSDWPYTFFEPRVLHAATEGQGGGNYYWTQDGSVILYLVKTEGGDGSMRYVAAYDFKEHRLLNINTAGSEMECSIAIEKLVKKRGGVGQLVVGLPDGKAY